MYDISLYKLTSKYKSSVYNCGKWIDGVRTKELEEKIKNFLGVKYVVLTNSGTSALLAAYWVLKNDFNTLIVDPYSFPATYQPARMLSYKVNFIRTILKPDFVKINNLTTITHLFGQPNRLALELESSNIPFIEDACQSFGARIGDRYVGTIGKIGCFSFYPTKSLHANGHAGAVVTNNEDYYSRLKVFIESGRLNGKMTNEIALNLRIDEIKAEYLLYELENFPERVEKQREIAFGFKEIVGNNQPFLKESADEYHVFSVFNLLIGERDNFRMHMKNNGIETMVYYNDDVLPKDKKTEYQDLTSRIVAIPCRWNLTIAEIKRIKKALRSWFK